MEIHETGHLFEQVQMTSVFEDSKTFPDCMPKLPLSKIVAQYEELKNTPEFDLKAFVLANFDLPRNTGEAFESDPNRTIVEHIEALWDVLVRPADFTLPPPLPPPPPPPPPPPVRRGRPFKAVPVVSVEPPEPVEPPESVELIKDSLIPLPFPYVVPGGRFREMYYWDSYFTMLGLVASERFDIVNDMMRNFAYLIRTYGYVPNGNRTYYLGRSQPPVFALMVQLCEDYVPFDELYVLRKYQVELQMEYDHWMRKTRPLKSSDKSFLDNMFYFPSMHIMNRYCDQNSTPRPEAYKEDVALATKTKELHVNTYRHIRAAAESGWDFSSRWFRTSKNFSTIYTADLIPIDLNCMLYVLEQKLAQVAERKFDDSAQEGYTNRSINRADRVNSYNWDEKRGYYFDLDARNLKRSDRYTLAAAFPLFVKIASPKQAKKVAKVIMEKFLQPGGLTTTEIYSGQQWDAPNGWAPLHWVVYKGFMNYKLKDAAKLVKERWMATNERVYANTGRMMEKYNVVDDSLEAGGGEYPLQDGFGWSNGVYMAMKANLVK
ncbi:MAG: trehalase family glycosidase [Saprospiraceae bacterium]|nr:trehalase family glycosidase [Saprospiraceae bacterium]